MTITCSVMSRYLKHLAVPTLAHFFIHISSRFSKNTSITCFCCFRGNNQLSYMHMCMYIHLGSILFGLPEQQLIVLFIHDNQVCMDSPKASRRITIFYTCTCPIYNIQYIIYNTCQYIILVQYIITGNNGV